MSSFRAMLVRALSAVRRNRADQDLNDEIQSHLDLHVSENLRAGMTPDAARRQALLRFGGIDQTKEHYRERRGLPRLESILRDFRFGARLLRRDPGFTATVVLTLGLGIGANAAIFSAVNSLFLRKLHVANPDSLVRLTWFGRNDMATDQSDYGFSGRDGDGLNIRSTFSYLTYRQFVASNRTMDEVFACAPMIYKVSVVVDGHADTATAFVTSGNYYRALGLAANPGRTIVPEDDQPAAPPVAVISARYWRSRFGSDPQTVGRTVLVNNAAVTIVGVISPELIDVQNTVHQEPDIATPLAFIAQLANIPTAAGEPNLPLLDRPTYWWLQVMGRVKAGVKAEQVQANLDPVFQRTARAGLDAYLASLRADVRSTWKNRNLTEVPRLRADSGSRGIYNVNPSDVFAVKVLSAVVVLVLLIVCANVATLLLSRATARRKEFTVRLSLGASRGRLIRQWLTESFLLAALGGAFGILIGHWSLHLLPFAIGEVAPVDWRVLLSVLVVISGTAITFGMAPAFRSTDLDLSLDLKETSRSATASRGHLSRVLLVGQVALSVVLLLAAGLFLQTLRNLRHVEFGFDTRNLVVFRTSPMLSHYNDGQTFLLYRQIIDGLQSVPGVRSVALSNQPLLANSRNVAPMFIQGRSYASDSRDSVSRLVISMRYFETMGMTIVRGRGFTDRDGANAPKVAIINEAAARTFFPNEDPLGHRFGTTLETMSELEVVGVLHDAKYDSVRNPVEPTIYVPYMQQPRTPQTVFQVRTGSDPGRSISTIRDVVRQIDPNLPLMNMSTQVDLIEGQLRQERVFAQASTLFGALALLLTSVALFGVTSSTVAQRTNEIGIRIALGAQNYDVLTLMMRESMALVVTGLAVGFTTAFAVRRFVATFVFGLAPTDGPTMLAVVVLLVLVCALATYVPAWRASRLDPIQVLREQ